VKPASSKLTLLCLADCHNSDNGRCDPSVAFVTEFTGLDRKTVIKALETLKALGLISFQKRRGNSTQYHLHIADHPVPAREKGERKKVVSITTPKQLDLSQKRDNPILGYPNNGTTENGTPGCPKNGTPPIPKTGHEPTKNLPVEPTSYSDLDRSASGAGAPVDNSMRALGEDYRSPSHEKLIFDRGVNFLVDRGLQDKHARAFLGKCLKDNPPGRVLDAVITAVLCQPEGDPKAYILQVLANPDKPMDPSWEPDDATLAELQALGIPSNLIRQARDTFVTWFRHMEIYHSNWPMLFKRWVIRDWEAAEFQAFQYRRRLAESAGFAYEPTLREPA
jgi:hypothetical protein